MPHGLRFCANPATDATLATSAGFRIGAVQDKVREAGPAIGLARPPLWI